MGSKCLIRASAEDLAAEFKKKLYKTIKQDEENEGEEDNIEIDRVITREELVKAFKDIKNGKSPGPDGITAEVHKQLPEVGVTELLETINKLWETGEVPRSFKEATIFPIYKKGNKEEAKNYRGVSLLNIGGNILTKILQKEMEKYAEKNELITKCQAGYREGYSTIDHVYTLKGLIEICRKTGKKLYSCFVDKSAAFDKVNRAKLIRRVKEMFDVT